MRFNSFSFLTLGVTALLLSACGGGGNESPTKVKITAVKTAGDSLLDIGALQGLNASDNKGLGNGRIFSVQSSADEPDVIWSERIASNSNLPKLCTYYKASAITTFSTTDGCYSFAVGRSSINHTDNTLIAAGQAGSDSAYSITKQLTDMGNKGFSGSELVLIDGGGNDASELFKAYLKAGTDSGASFATLTTSLGGSSASSISSVLAGSSATKLATAGTLYMQALADHFYTSIDTNLLRKGAKQIAILYIPKVTATVKLQQTYSSLKGAPKNLTEEQISVLDTMINTWVKAFNTRLVEKAAGNSSIQIIDFYTAFEDQIRNPAQFGLTNVSKEACPVTSVDATGANYSPGVCTAASLSASIPAGETKSDWWKTYAFADNFHPTPYGHKLISQLVSISLARAGWLQ